MPGTLQDHSTVTTVNRRKVPSGGKNAVSMTTLITPPGDMRYTPKEQLFELEFYPLLDALYGYALRLTNDATRAEDLVQETFMKAWKSLSSYTSGTNAKAWLFKICKNLFINEYRSIVRQPRKVDYEEIVVFHNDNESASLRFSGLREDVGDQLLGDEVMNAMGKLSPAFRDVLMLDLEGFTYEEIAKLLEIPIGTVRSRLHRARNLMADQLREYAREQGYRVQDEQTTTPTETATSAEGNQSEVAAPSTAKHHL
jgi:RNA polymerase sigma-70 factor (ECF subfamily)